MSAAEAERAFAARFRGRWGADAAPLTGGDGAGGSRRGGEGGRGEEDEIDRLLPRIVGVGRRKKRAVASAPSPLESCGSARAPDALRRCLWAVLRRFSGRLQVRGRLLNLEELLVTHVMRDDTARGRQRSIRVPDSAVRVVVRCVDAAAAQIGQDGVQASVVAPRDVDAQLWMADDASGDDVLPLDSTRPVAVVSAAVESEDAWGDPQLLEEMQTVYGFDVDAFASAGWDVTAELSDEEEQPLSALLMSSRLFHDLRGPDKMMEMFQISPDSFQSFAWAAASKHRQQAVDGAKDELGASSEPDPWSYRELDSAQKRKWADERFEYGLELVEKRKLREATAEFESALKLNDRHARALAAKGRAHTALHQLQDAVDCLEQAVSIDPLLDGAHDDLLRAKGMLAHSRHVSSDSRYDLSKARVEIDRVVAKPLNRSPRKQPEPRDRSSKRSIADDRRSSTKSAKSLEEERLRALLEEDVRRRKESRPSRRRSHSESDESESSDGSRGRSRERRRSSSKKRKRDKKHKKEKRKHKKSDRKRRSKKSGRKDGDRYESDYSSSDSRASRSSDGSRRSSRRRSPCGGSKSRAEGDVGSSDLPAILSRTKHRIWN